MRHRTPRARGQPLRAVCPRNVVRLFRPKGRNWMPRIYSGHPTVRLPQAEAWAERERVPSGHNCRRQLATGRPEQIQEPGTAVPGTPIFANNAKRGGPPLESPCRQLSLVLSFASKESTAPPRGGSPTNRAVVGASGRSGTGVCACGRTKGLSSGQTIGAVRTAVRSACCLPELRVANRLRRLYPLDTRFPSFPFGNLRAPKLAGNSWVCKPDFCTLRRRVMLHRGKTGLDHPLS